MRLGDMGFDDLINFPFDTSDNPATKPNEWYTLERLFGFGDLEFSIRLQLDIIRDRIYERRILEQQEPDTRKGSELSEEEVRKLFDESIEQGFDQAIREIKTHLVIPFYRSALYLRFSPCSSQEFQDGSFSQAAAEAVDMDSAFPCLQAPESLALPYGHVDEHLHLDFMMDAGTVDTGNTVVKSNRFIATTYGYALLIRTSDAAHAIYVSAPVADDIRLPGQTERDIIYKVEYQRFAGIRADSAGEILAHVESQQRSGLIRLLTDPRDFFTVKPSTLVVPPEPEKVKSLQVMLLDRETDAKTLSQLLSNS